MDKRFTDLLAADLPLTGTEIMAIVQGGVSRQVPISELVTTPEINILVEGLDTVQNEVEVLDVEVTVIRDDLDLFTVSAFLTFEVEPLLVNSRQMIAGTGVTFDLTNPGEFIINASGSGPASVSGVIADNGTVVSSRNLQSASRTDVGTYILTYVPGTIEPGTRPSVLVSPTTPVLCVVSSAGLDETADIAFFETDGVTPVDSGFEFIVIENDPEA